MTQPIDQGQAELYELLCQQRADMVYVPAESLISFPPEEDCDQIAVDVSKLFHQSIKGDYGYEVTYAPYLGGFLAVLRRYALDCASDVLRHRERV